MNRIILILIFTIPTCVCLKAQNWIKIGDGLNHVVTSFYNDTNNNLLYIGGGFKLRDDSLNLIGTGIAAYNGDSLIPVGCGFDWNCISDMSPGATPQGPFDIVKYNGDLITGGGFMKAQNKPIRRIAKWDGLNWDSLGHGVNNPIKRLFVHNGELYVGGAFDTAGYVVANGLAKWNGSQWTDVGNFPNNF